MEQVLVSTDSETYECTCNGCENPVDSEGDYCSTCASYSKCSVCGDCSYHYEQCDNCGWCLGFHDCTCDMIDEDGDGICDCCGESDGCQCATWRCADCGTCLHCADHTVYDPTTGEDLCYSCYESSAGEVTECSCDACDAPATSNGLCSDCSNWSASDCSGGGCVNCCPGETCECCGETYYHEEQDSKLEGLCDSCSTSGGTWSECGHCLTCCPSGCDGGDTGETYNCECGYCSNEVAASGDYCDNCHSQCVTGGCGKCSCQEDYICSVCGRCGECRAGDGSYWCSDCEVCSECSDRCTCSGTDYGTCPGCKSPLDSDGYCSECGDWYCGTCGADDSARCSICQTCKACNNCNCENEE